MDLENRHIRMAQLMRANGSLINSMVKVFMNGLMEENIKVLGGITSCMEKESILAATGEPTKGSISMTRSTSMGSITGPTGGNTRVNGSMGNRMDMVCLVSLQRKVRRLVKDMGNGKREKRSIGLQIRMKLKKQKKKLRIQRKLIQVNLSELLFKNISILIKFNNYL